MRTRWLVAVLVILVASAAAAAPKKYKAEATAELLAAAAEGEYDRIVAALKAGADPNGKNEDGRTALILAATQQLWNHEKDTVAALKTAGAKLDTADKVGFTPLMASVMNGRTDMTKALIAAGAKVDAKDADGWTALMYSAVNNTWSDAEELLKAKANIEVATADGYTALLLAINDGRSSVAERLIKAGAKWPKTKGDLSPIIMAAFGRDLQSLRYALQSGADINAVDSEGWTALETTAFNDDRQMVMELLRSGADPSLKDKEGKTALDRATERDNKEVMALLSGKWSPPKGKGTTISVPCPVLGGTINTAVSVDGANLVLATAYPHPVNYYLGGGFTNRGETAKKYTYDASFTPEFSVGSAYKIDYMEYGTSVTLQYKDSRDNDVSKPVYAHTLSLDVKKGDEDVDVSELEHGPEVVNEGGVLVSRVPLSVLALKPGGTVKVGAKFGNCGPVTQSVKLK